MRKVLFFLLVGIYCNVVFGDTIEEATIATQRGDHDAAFKILLPLAEAGDVNALGNVGNKYAFGLGVKKNLKKSYYYWSLAADKHLGTAMFNIATLHASGLGGLKKDFPEAISWYVKAAEHKHSRAMINLSTLYATGRGVNKDTKLAAAWAAIAVNKERSKKLKKEYLSQFKTLVDSIPKDEFAGVQEIVDKIEKKIKINVKKFNNQ